MNVLRLVRSFATAAPDAIRNTVKPLDSRKTFLMDTYTHMWRNNQIVLLAHHNNLQSAENESLRKQLAQKTPGCEIRKLRGSIFKHFLRASFHNDPASLAALRAVKRRKIRHPLENLLKGPTAAIIIPELDPKIVKELGKILKSHKEKFFIMGGKVGDEFFDLQGVKQFAELKSLPELRAELVGLLSMAGGAGLVKTLESASQNLVLSMESRKLEMEKDSENGNDNESQQNGDSEQVQ